MELEQFREALEAEGVSVAVITYDSQEILARFADQFSIGYPLLADAGSSVIRGFGILNTDMPEGNMFHGIPYPGSFLLSPDGRVKEKYFVPDYQTRASAGEVLATTFGRNRGPAVELSVAEVSARIALSDDRVVPGRQLGVTVDLSIAPGWHVYGAPLPDGYVATEVVFDEDVAVEQSLEFPEPKRVRFDLLGETLPTYAGSVQATGTLLVRSRLAPGRYAIQGELRCQQCSQETCSVPQTIRFEIPIEVLEQAPPIESAEG